jgi:hypothetical protein
MIEASILAWGLLSGAAGISAFRHAWLPADDDWLKYQTLLQDLAHSQMTAIFLSMRNWHPMQQDVKEQKVCPGKINMCLINH